MVPMPAEPARYSLRDLLTGKALRDRIPASPAARPTRIAPLLRPPGALPEPDFIAACTQCGDCLVACPHRTLFMAPARFGRAAASPMLDPVIQPCWMCPDTPCIASCRPHALRGGTDAFPRIATARIEVNDCLAHQGTTCTTCVERCPSPGALVIESGRPQVIADRCTGCGVCQHVCPAPHNAIALMPALRTEPPVPYL